MLLLYLNFIVVLLMVNFYGNRTVMVLENVVHSETTVLEEYIIFHITHMYGYYYGVNRRRYSWLPIMQ